MDVHAHTTRRIGAAAAAGTSTAVIVVVGIIGLAITGPSGGIATEPVEPLGNDAHRPEACSDVVPLVIPHPMPGVTVVTEVTAPDLATPQQAGGGITADEFAALEDAIRPAAPRSIGATDFATREIRNRP